MTNFPEGDTQFEDVKIDKAESQPGGWAITRADHWSLFCPAFVGATPKAGDTLRIYGRGIGYPFRGLFVNGTRVFYRTEAEDKDHREIESYGADAADWLKRWDAGRSVWSISMGGLGPGYEQCIQIVAAEGLRWLLERKPDVSLWDDTEVWKAFCDEFDKALFTADKKLEPLGLSGAQASAGQNLAIQLYRNGPRKIMNDDRVKDRKIQVSRDFPRLAA